MARGRSMPPRSDTLDSWNIALQATLRPEDLEILAGSSERGDVRSPGLDKTKGFDDVFYKTRGRGSPTLWDLQARTQIEGAQSPFCICELCDCGKHACPVHGEIRKVLKQRPKFDGKSCYAQDYISPPSEPLKEKLRKTQDQTLGKRPRPKFEGNSTYRADFTSKKSDDTLLRPRSSTAKLPKQRMDFDAESSMRRDFTPPPKEAYSPSMKSVNDTKSISKPTRPKFDGESSMRRDYTPPPRVAQDSFAASPAKSKSGRVRPPFDAASTYDSDFTNKWKDVFGKPRCQASILLEKQPPTPGSGREHIYWDSIKNKWI